MDVNISDVFETRREKKCVAINSYKFSEFRENKDTTKIFRCTNRKYTVTAKLTTNLKTVISINGEHSHDELVEETITKQTVMSLLKRKATTDLNMKPNKLIRQELRHCPKSEHLSHSDVRLFRKSMYEAKRKIFPKIPKSLLEAKAMMF
ncbi:FLYWCH-type domain-containing protein [Aphis craccivora]|uniref:FLYWCH-type domain-containing protein n=1 Tax=Aphis craccivora TaxID=307492 RepID=A0A6G0VP99_APHCR|nr:FLYWCH-type domain-containing protein [Aphis craccivora]